MGVMAVNRTVIALFGVFLMITVAGCLDSGTVKLPGKQIDDVIEPYGNSSSGGSVEGSSGGGIGAGGSGASSGRVTITFWHTFEHPKEIEVLNDAIKQFEEDNPNIKVNVQQQPYDGAVEKYITAAQGGEGPDVMRVPNDRLGSLAYFDLIDPLDEYISVPLKAKYVDMAMNAMTYNGHIYALPASYDCMALVYNKNMLEEYGYSEPPATLDEMVQMAENMTKGNKYGIVIPITDPYWWFPFQAAYGGSVFDASNNPTINSEASVNATSFLMNLEKKYHVVPEGGVDKTTMLSLFTEGKAAMIVTGPWDLGNIKAAEINYGIAPMPENSGTGLPSAPMVGVKGYVISKASEHKVESYELIKYLTSAKVEERFALVSNTLPSIKSVYTSPDIRNNSDLQGFLAQAEKGQLMPTIPEMSAVWGPLTTALQAVYTGELDAKKAIEKAQSDIEEQIASGG